MTGIRGACRAVAVLLLAGAAGCGLPFPDSAEGPAITWIDSPAPVRFNPPTDDRFGVWRVETVAEPTVPSILESDPFDAPDIPGISATHYEGTGFAIRVPPPCKRLTTGGRPVHLEVDGLTREYRGEMKYVSPVAAIYVTVAGRGIVTGPRIGTVSGGLILADTWDTLHVPERDSYAVTLWCDYPDPDPAKPPVRVSYSATVEHPGR